MLVRERSMGLAACRGLMSLFVESLMVLCGAGVVEGVMAQVEWVFGRGQGFWGGYEVGRWLVGFVYCWA